MTAIDRRATPNPSAAYVALSEVHIAEATSLLDTALQAAGRIDDPQETAIVLSNMGLARLFSGDLDQARDAFERALRLCAQHAFGENADEGLAAARRRYGDIPWRAEEQTGAALSREQAIAYALGAPGETTQPSADEGGGFTSAGQGLEKPARGGERLLATVMFTDIVGSTAHAADIGDQRWRALLDSHDAVVRAELNRAGGVEIKLIGDGLLATFNGPARAIDCACAIRAAVRVLGIQIRAGIHTGEIELRDNDIGGIGVHITARVAARARPGEILVSHTVTELVAGSGIRFDERGLHELKGVPGSWRLCSVLQRSDRHLRANPAPSSHS